MPNPTVTPSSAPTETPSSPKNNDVQEVLTKQVTELQKQLEKLGDGQKLLQDPQVQELLSRRAKGEKLEFRVKDDVPPKDPLEELLALTDQSEQRLDGGKEVSVTDPKFIKTLQDSIAGLVSQTVKPLKDELESLRSDRQKDTEQQEVQALVSEVQSVAEKHADFKDFADDIIKLRAQPLRVEDLYYLAKVKKVGLPQDLETERPSNPLELVMRDKKSEMRPGRVGFQEIVQKVLTNRHRS